MSAVRLYLLEVEKDKAGATHIAKQTSDRMDLLKIIFRFCVDASSRPGYEGFEIVRADRVPWRIPQQ
jgi:hypothetical protein